MEKSRQWLLRHCMGAIGPRTLAFLKDHSKCEDEAAHGGEGCWPIPAACSSCQWQSKLTEVDYRVKKNKFQTLICIGALHVTAMDTAP